ncbi:glutamine-hydrolyzing carbamoyl-phosphate synthase small subunit [Tepidiforma sp.]|uniref:glutamine-hydrolyzing carbamoyl-phosphate synthase small subunit n=1 Tax=Tepidiforma sp. TaxID=2682230 RepID=UPI002ADDE5B1|nr:glutamine-hydrolyzing carbamoyl-phosphate synthase small subunit [Tepidiforma sp.]
MSDAWLVLADGTAYPGRSIGAAGHADGEVVFNTSMTGYQEMLTDPSYAGQLLVLTYPLIGNYGIDERVEESARIQPAGLIVRQATDQPSHLRSHQTVREYLQARGVVAIDGVDTRAVTRRIRRHGVMLGTITTHETPEQALARVRDLPGYDDINWVEQVTTPRVFDWSLPLGEGRYRVALLDGGVKRNIMRLLEARGCAVRVFPAATPADDILALHPDGVVLSPGPGDPRLLDGMVREVGRLIGRVPIFGICLGHQVAARALGAGTYKLPFGHRGGNHPVKDLVSGHVAITAQNHGYAVDPDGLHSSAFVSHINLNDQTVEGIASKTDPLMTIQYHSEACPGPLDNEYIFDRFVEMMATVKGGVK